MKRRSKAGSKKPVKAPRRKALKPKRDAPKAVAHSDLSNAGREIAVARLTRELNEALEQRAATAEVLHLMSGSHGDLARVFGTILANATRLCEANFGMLSLYEGDGCFRVVAMHNAPPAFAELRRREPVIGPLVLMAATKQLLHISDLTEHPTYRTGDPDAVAFFELTGVRTVLSVPLLKDNELIGAIVVYRTEVRPFADKQMELLKNFAAQAVIAIENTRLLNELRQRTTDLTQRTTDLTEALEQQTATSEVLQVISNSSGVLEPVFATMLENAVRICDATFGTIYRSEGDVLHVVATHNAPLAYAEAIGRLPLRPNPNTALGRTTATKTAVHVANLAAEKAYNERRDPRYVAAVELGGVRTFLAVPMLKDEELIGVFTVCRQEVRPFTDKQIELVKNFAAQAVIAIENARLLNELRQRTDDLGQRTADLTEALEQQTATSEVLKVISGSLGDLGPVFAAMLESATRLCEASFGSMQLREGDGFRRVAMHNAPVELLDFHRGAPVISIANAKSLADIVKTKAVIQVPDLQIDDPETPLAKYAGARTLLVVPLLKEHEVIGAFGLFRREVRAFSEKQIEVVVNFAAQAVIAIENARLLTELRQSLEQQTATSEVLGVISGSPGELEPVFAAILENATRLCSAHFGNLLLYEGGTFRFAAMYNAPKEWASFRKREPLADLNPLMPAPRVAASRRAIQIIDLTEDDPYKQGDPDAVALVELAGARTLVVVPMLKDEEVVGVIAIYRREVHAFDENQVGLLQNFAAQAVIAIENARLLNELRQRTADLTERTADLTETLEQQTATSEVLQVITSSPGNLQPVFASMLQKALHICEAKFGMLALYENDLWRTAAVDRPSLAENTPGSKWGHWLLAEPRRFGPETALGRLAQTKRLIHIPDVRKDVESTGVSPTRSAFLETGARSLLAAPLLKEGKLIGTIALYRQELRPFTYKQIAVIENFAAQAVIAIENAHLLKELQERTDQVTQLNQHLEQRVTDQVGEIERMGRLRRFLPPQVADLIVASGTEKQLESHRREITALFCDLRGFTGFTESADAEDVMALLRDYHATVGEKIIKYSGTLERYAGDGVMVVFNDPVPVENPALQAVFMALEMRDAIGALTETWHRWGHDIGFGIGIAHGFATLGTIGFEGRFDYAAIGTVSNVASRLCDEAKPGQILISARVLTKVENVVKVEPVGEFELKGIRRPLAAYNVVAAATREM